MTALSCDDVVGRLVNAGVPVLFLDTCLILDIVRAPIREPISVPDIQAVHTLLSRVAQTPPTVSVVIADQVEHEFQEHIEKVERETLTELKRTRERFAGILERMAALAPSHDIPDSVDLERCRIRLTISDMPDEGGAFVWRELIEKGADLGPEGVDGAFRGLSKQGFQL